MKKSIDFLLGTWESQSASNPQAAGYLGAEVWDGKVETLSWERHPSCKRKVRLGLLRSGQIMASYSLWPSESLQSKDDIRIMRFLEDKER